ncbi:MSD3 protein, partial [Acromyrmex charruanus]
MKGEKRAPNFSKCEEQLLISLVEKYKNIIECKKSNVVTCKDKEKVWLKIESEFNSKNNGNAFRSVKYNNLKKDTKRKFALEKINASKIGGGPFT